MARLKNAADLLHVPAYVIHLFKLKKRHLHRNKTAEMRSLIKIFSLSTGNGYKERSFVCSGSYFRNSFGGVHTAQHEILTIRFRRGLTAVNHAHRFRRTHLVKND